MIIVLHCVYVKSLIETNIDLIIKSLVPIFVNYQIFLDLFLQARLIDIMDCRVSQPLNHLLSQDLQWSSISSSDFCGDWLDSTSFGGVESSMESSIRLA